MPIFEFACIQCGQSFEELVFSLSKIEEVVCPTCGSKQVRKKMSAFASKVEGISSFPTGSALSSSCSTGSV